MLVYQSTEYRYCTCSTMLRVQCVIHPAWKRLKGRSLVMTPVLFLMLIFNIALFYYMTIIQIVYSSQDERSLSPIATPDSRHIRLETGVSAFPK